MEPIYFLLGILVIILIIAAVVAFIIHKIRSFSNTAFGTPDIAQALRNQQQTLAETPRSISAMTRIYLPQISSDFPEFNYDDYKRKAENIIKGYLNALQTGNNITYDYASDTLKNQIQSEIESLKSLNYKRYFDSKRIHKTEISAYKKENGLCIVSFQSSVEFFDYTKNSSGHIVKGSSDLKRQTVFQTDLVYVQDASLIDDKSVNAASLTCPHCGAPVTSIGNKVCEYCGSGIKEINIYSWNFNSITEK